MDDFHPVFILLHLLNVAGNIRYIYCFGIAQDI